MNYENKQYKIYAYITINKINGKCYIGSHLSHSDKDNYLGSGNLIKAAIKKYGKNNFQRIILKYYDTLLEARKSEETYILKFDTITPNGYNISPAGGCNFKTGFTSEETCNKLSRALKGKKHSNEHNKNVSKSLLGRTRNPEDSKKAWKTKKESGDYVPWNKGKTNIYSSETIKKISQFRKNSTMLPETKEKIKNSLKGIPVKANKINKECEYCHKILNIGNYHRWHGENCKYKK
jgi:group I intron endonuclease